MHITILVLAGNSTLFRLLAVTRSYSSRPFLWMIIALTWTIKAVTPHSNIITMITVFWSGVSQTTWCLENCFSAITGHVIKQDGSSTLSKPHTTNGWSKHKNSCEDKLNNVWLNQQHHNSVASILQVLVQSKDCIFPALLLILSVTKWWCNEYRRTGFNCVV